MTPPPIPTSGADIPAATVPGSTASWPGAESPGDASGLSGSGSDRRRRDDDDGGDDDQEPTSAWRVLLEVVLVIGTALVLSVLVRAFLVQAFYVPSGSMEDTLLPSDRIIASKITTRLSGVQRGEVVVFRDPGGWLPEPPAPRPGFQTTLRNAMTFVGLLPSDTGKDLVKRVIGTEGDRIRCCDRQGRIVLNGRSLDEPYIKPGDATDQVTFDITVPRGGLFVMGDNRSDSRDSRYHLEDNSGAVPVDNVVGRVVLVVWPLSRIATVPVPDTFASVPPAPASP